MKVLWNMGFNQSWLTHLTQMSLSTSSSTSTKPGNYKSCTWSLVTRKQRKQYQSTYWLINWATVWCRVSEPYMLSAGATVPARWAQRCLAWKHPWISPYWKSLVYKKSCHHSDKQCWKVPCVWIKEDRLFHFRWISMAAVPHLQERTGLQPACVLFINDTRTHKASISAVYDVVASSNSCSHQTRSTPVWVWSNECWHNTSETAIIVQTWRPAPSMQMHNIVYEYQNVHLQRKEHKMCDVLWL